MPGPPQITQRPCAGRRAGAPAALLGADAAIQCERCDNVVPPTNQSIDGEGSAQRLGAHAVRCPRCREGLCDRCRASVVECPCECLASAVELGVEAKPPPRERKAGPALVVLYLGPYAVVEVVEAVA